MNRPSVHAWMASGWDPSLRLHTRDLVDGGGGRDEACQILPSGGEALAKAARCYVASSSGNLPEEAKGVPMTSARLQRIAHTSTRLGWRRSAVKPGYAKAGKDRTPAREGDMRVRR